MKGLDILFTKKNIFFIKDNLKNKNDLFKLIASKAYENKYVKSEKECYDGLVYRENMQSTGFQDGFAIPHCKDKTVIDPKLLIFKTNPIDWDSLDGKPVVFSFALLVPDNASREHLIYLSKIAKLLTKKEYRNKLKLSSVEEIYEIVVRGLEDIS